MNHIYIRFDWADVEKEKGVYDWSCIDEIMNKWKGLKFSFRPCTYETGFYYDDNAVPMWLTKIEGAGKIFRCYFNSEGRWLGDSQGDAYMVKDENTIEKNYFEPYYDNEVYLDAAGKVYGCFWQKNITETTALNILMSEHSEDGERDIRKRRLTHWKY